METSRKIVITTEPSKKSYFSESFLNNFLADSSKYNDEDLDNFEVIIIDSSLADIEIKHSEKVTIYKKPIYLWLDENDPNTITGEVIFVVLSEEPKSTYDIMEIFCTQKYDSRKYLSYSGKVNSDFFKFIDLLILEESSDIENDDNVVTSPRYSTRKIDTQYELYSGKKIKGNTSDIDREAILNRMSILIEYITHYINFGLTKVFDISKYKKLPTLQDGYTREQFFTNKEISSMVKFSYMFQVEDPILKGFFLAHPIRIGGDSLIQTSEINLQELIFDSGQFRRSLLLSLISVVASFAANNSILFATDFKNVEAPEIKINKAGTSKQLKSSYIAPKSRRQSGVEVLKLQTLKLKPEVSDNKTTAKQVKPEYYSVDFWKMLDSRISNLIP